MDVNPTFKRYDELRWDDRPGCHSCKYWKPNIHNAEAIKQGLKPRGICNWYRAHGGIHTFPSSWSVNEATERTRMSEGDDGRNCPAYEEGQFVPWTQEEHWGAEERFSKLKIALVQND